MKRILQILLLLLLVGSAYGKPIDENTAKIIGQSFFETTLSKSFRTQSNSLELVYKAESKSNNPLADIIPITFFYVFNVGTTGFVIIAGDDNVTPILGYSDENNFDPDHLPQNVAKWLEGYKSEIRYVIDKRIRANEIIDQQWNNLRKGSKANARTEGTSAVSPLLQTKWNQSPYYNSLCPGGSVTGCVATAMSQVMKYWNYPATGSGFHSYNHPNYGTLSANFGNTTYQWASMPNMVTNSNNAVATLMYHVGISVDMNYSPQVSGAYVISDYTPVVNCAEYALKTYFGYRNSLQGIQRKNYTNSQWLDLLKVELDAGRPIIYAGFGSGGGHCFVADGYDNNNYIHFNWGWGGYNDGYFQMNALNPNGVGTGGGDGGYNSEQQAIIGVQPPATNQTFNMALYNYVTPSSSTINYGQAFSITTNITNKGTTTFNGDYTAAVFDEDLHFIDYVQTLTGYSLQGGYAYNSNLVFSTTGLYGMLPGNYYVGIFHRPNGSNWYQVANNNSYVNLVPMRVVNSNNIELNAALTIVSGNTITQGESISVKFNIVNDGTGSFIGKYGMGLYNLDGSLAQSIGTLNENNGLSPGYTYLSPYLTISSSAITIPPGTYLLAAQHNRNNTIWELTGSSYYQNPIKVTVVAPTLQADQYEVNNVIGQSYNLPVSFTGNNANVNTIGSNCHLTSDNDFYKVTLPSGYNYTITPRLHDSYNSGNSNSYTLDGLVTYSTDGISWSDSYDDIVPNLITINDGGVVYFRIAPFFAGETGTYLLDVGISRSVILSVDSGKEQSLFKIYPNPATDIVSVDLSGFKGQVDEISLLDSRGQTTLSKEAIPGENILDLSLKNTTNGLYFLQMKTSSGVLVSKIVVVK